MLLGQILDCKTTEIVKILDLLEMLTSAKFLSNFNVLIKKITKSMFSAQKN